MGIIIGLLTFHAPQVTALALIIYIAAWALMIGASEIALAVKLRHEIKGEWFLILMGLASIIFAVLLLWNPVAGGDAVIWLHRMVRSCNRRSGPLLRLPPEETEVPVASFSAARSNLRTEKVGRSRAVHVIRPCATGATITP